MRETWGEDVNTDLNNELKNWKFGQVVLSDKDFPFNVSLFVQLLSRIWDPCNKYYFVCKYVKWIAAFDIDTLIFSLVTVLILVILHEFVPPLRVSINEDKVPLVIQTHHSCSMPLRAEGTVLSMGASWKSRSS